MGPLSRALAAAVLVALALLGAGCRESEGEGVEAVPPEERLARSAATASALESFRIAFTAEGELTDPPAALGPLDGSLAAEGEGAVAPPDRASVDATLRSQGLAVQLNLTRFGDELAVSFFGTTAGLDVPPEDLARLDLGALYPTLAGWATAPEEVGTEEVDGATTVHLRAGLDAKAVAADLAPLLGALDVEGRAALGRALADDAVEFWIGAQDDLPRRVRLALDAEGPEVAGAGVGAVRIDATIGLSEFDAPVEIDDPEPIVTLDPENLEDLLPG